MTFFQCSPDPPYQQAWHHEVGTEPRPLFSSSKRPIVLPIPRWPQRSEYPTTEPDIALLPVYSKVQPSSTHRPQLRIICWAFVSAEDWPDLIPHTWLLRSSTAYPSIGRSLHHPQSPSRSVNVGLHRQIALRDEPQDCEVKFRDGNFLNCTQSNLYLKFPQFSEPCLHRSQIV